MNHNLLIPTRLDPAKARELAQPLDTDLYCPECSSAQVAANAALATERFFDKGFSGGHRSDMELAETVPRLQDRQCLECGHEWTTVLPPKDFAKNFGKR